MASESADRRARARRERQPNVAGGRPHRCVVKLSDAEQAELAARAEAASLTVPRLLVETTLGEMVDVGRSSAVLALLELDEQIRRVGNNVNQLTRYAHQEQGLPEETAAALRAVVRACLAVDATARWVMGKAPAVSAGTIAEAGLADDGPDGGVESWATQIDE